jgi:centrosomal CEP192-like protein
VISTKDGARRARRRTRATITTAAALVAAAALAGPASANLTTTGPVAPNGFPAWYGDADGTQAELCIQDSGCPSSPPSSDFKSPDGEAFYQLASAAVTDAAGHDVTVEMNVEAAFLGPDAADPVHDQITFGRVQVTLKGMQPNTDYTITYPYGQHVWRSDENGELLGGDRTRQRIETGCPDTPCNFDTAFGSVIGPFLQWDPAVAPAAPSGYLGDGVTEHSVVGSPFGTNFVRVNGPDLPQPVVDPITGDVVDPGGITTDQFLVEGKRFSGPSAIFFAPQGAGAFGNHTVGTSTSKDIEIKNNGLADMTLGATGITGTGAAQFAKTADGCAGTTVASGATCTISVTFAPTSTGARVASLTVDQGGTTRSIALSGAGVNAAPPATGGTTQVPAGATPQTIIQIIQQAATPQVKGVKVSSPTVSRLTVTRRISVAHLQQQGLRASMAVQEGTNVVRIAIYKARDGRRTGRALFVTTRAARSGVLRVTLRSRSLLSKLRAGSYVMEVRAGQSLASLGGVRRIAFTVTK